MKKIFFLISLLALQFNAVADSLPILKNKAVENCVTKYGEEDSECLGSLNDKTNSELQNSYNEKFHELEKMDYTKWWMGSKEQKQSMLSAFKKSQDEWVQYRDNYCQVLTTSEQGGHAFGEVMLSCLINMNNNRIAEIKMTNP